MEAPVISTLLGVWAHPDDEAWLSAGLALKVLASGGRVVLVTATKGEAGVDVSDQPGQRPIEDLRLAEMSACLEVLGVREHHWLDYRDGALSQVPLEEGADRVAEFIAAVRPDVITTFGPDGMTGHVDHIAISAWTTRAWQAAGQPGRLWYATHSSGFAERWAQEIAGMGAMMDDIELTVYPPGDLAWLDDVTDERLDRKVAALAAHASQTSGIIRLLGGDGFREWCREEAFVDADQGMYQPA